MQLQKLPKGVLSMKKRITAILLAAFVTLLFGFIGFSIDDLLNINGAVFSFVLVIAAAASVVYYINKTKGEEKDDQE